MGAFEKLDSVEAAEDQVSFELVPPGKYHFEVISWEERVNQNGKDYIALRSVIHGPDSVGRQLFSDFWCTTEKSTKISKAQLLAISGGDVIGDLNGKHYFADVYIEKGSPNPEGGNWPDKNRQRNFKTYDPAELAAADVEAKKGSSGPRWDDAF